MPALDDARTIAVWGYGKEGRAALEFLRRRYPRARKYVLDDASLPEDAVPGGVDVIQGKTEVAGAIRSGRFEAVVKSPGISLYRDEIVEAKQRGVLFTSGTNLWFEHNPHVRRIVVTGTKGKSTTARVLHHILCGYGLKTALLGNVGVAAVSHLLSEDNARDDYAVIELSSYQAADLEHAPDFAIVTNLFPEHAPWHKGVEQYYKDKLRILRLSGRTVPVCNFASEELRARAGDLGSAVWFNKPGGFYVEDGALYCRGAKVDCSTSPLKGEHNLSNLAAACTLAELLRLPGIERRVNLEGFRQAPHRMEEFACGDVVCVDDSISTIPEATTAALNVYADSRVILFAGGAERGQNYRALARTLKDRHIGAVFLLPATGGRIYDELSRAGVAFPVIQAADLNEAVREAMGIAASGDVLLLSPGAPSFGQFRNFEERGRLFKELCRRHSTGPAASEGVSDA
jgi:UDP-N-acetylmuramoylalanine--D-glutamate ligase